MSGANLPLLNVIIPLPVEKSCSEGELDAQIEMNSFTSTKLRGYLLDPILCHHCNESSRKQSIQGPRKYSSSSFSADFSSTVLYLFDCHSINCIITFECLWLPEAKTSSIGVEVEACMGHTYSSMLSIVSKTKLCSH